jgi:hypothetical protein
MAGEPSTSYDFLFKVRVWLRFYAKLENLMIVNGCWLDRWY